MDYLLNDIQTERLKFRALTKEDAVLWLPFFENKLILTYFGIDPNLPEETLCDNWFKKVFNRYNNKLGGMNAIILRDTGAFIGQCGLLIQTVEGRERLEVGYSLLPNYRAKGYATEAAIACKEYAFKKGLASELISMIHVDNLASENVALKNGMSLEKTINYEGMPAKIYTIKKQS